MRAVHSSTTTLGGSMKWYLLREGKCPRCAYLLNQDEGTLIECENPHCHFKITSHRMKSIIMSMNEPKRDEETNASLLNNL